MAIVKRLDKGSALTYAELDGNFDHLVAADAVITATTTAIGAAVAAHVDDTAGAHADSAITFTPAGTGAVASTVQAKLRESVSVKDFGAVGNGVTDDTAAIQSALTYCATLASTTEWLTDDVPNTWGSTVELFFPDGVYAVTSSLVLVEGNKNLCIRNATIKATGAGWATTDYIFSTQDGNTTYITFENCKLNCSNVCSGIHARARHRIVGCHIDKVAGIGVYLDGSDAWIDRCIIGQWTNYDNEFFNQANYTGIGISTGNPDVRITNCVVRWLYECIKIEDTNILVANCHFFNGMEGFADYDIDGTYVGGGTGTAVGRTYHPLAVVTLKSGGSNNVSFSNCYFDNGTIELYENSVTFNDCKFACSSTISAATDTYWIKCYSEATSFVPRLRINNPQVWNNSLVKDLVQWDDNGFSWDHSYATYQASDFNLMNLDAEGTNLAPQHVFVSLAGQGLTGYPFDFVNMGNSCLQSFTDNTTTVASTFGGSGNNLFGEAEAVYFTTYALGCSNTIGGTAVLSRSGYGFDAAFTLSQRNVGDTAWVEWGKFFYDDSTGKTILRGAAAGQLEIRLKGDSGPKWTSGSGSPEGVLTAVIGSMYTRTDGGANTTLYIKESGTGNTGWVAK